MPNALQLTSYQMRQNVDYILNHNDHTDDIMKPAFQIKERPVYGYYSVKCKFIGITKTDKQPFEFEPFNIKFFNIKQSFILGYADEISLMIECTPVNLLMLYDNFKDLKVQIKLFGCSTKEEKVTSKPILTKVYRAAFKNKTDIRKRIPKTSLVPADNGLKTQGHADQYISVEFQLIEDDIYILRHKTMTYLMHNCTVKDIILNCCKLFGIKKISFVEPDNKQKYENVVIPPLLTFEQVFSYINEYFGVYNSGYTYFYTGGVLYIYPAYDVNINTPNKMNFYYVGDSQYNGLEVYHAIDTEDNKHVVINSNVSVTNLQDTGADNLGTHFIGFDVDHVIDNTTSITESTTPELARFGNGALKVTRLKTYMQASGIDDIGITFDVFKPQYVFDWNNKYAIPNMLASYRGTVINFLWTSAVPYTIVPGHSVKYHYDGEIVDKRKQDVTVGNNYKYETLPGICTGVEYRLDQIGRYTNHIVFRSYANVTCFLVKESNITKDDVDKHNKENPDTGIIRMQ